MYFDTKNYLKNTRNHTAKHALRAIQEEEAIIIDLIMISWCWVRLAWDKSKSNSDLFKPIE